MIDVDALLRENAEQRAQIRELTAQVGKLTEQLAKMNDRIAELVAVAQRRQRKAPLEKPPVPPPLVEGEAKRAFEERPKAPEKPEEPPRTKSKAKPTGRKPVPAADRRAQEDPSKRVREAFAEEQPRLLALPDQPFPTDEVEQVETGKTPYARFDLNDYSVPHTHVRRSLSVAASLDTVRILDGVEVVAVHQRSWDRGQQLEDPAHIQPILDEKRRAREHRGLDRLRAAAPSAMRFLELAAERGGNLGNITARLLVVLDQFGGDELELAIRAAVERDVPTVGAVRQLLDQRLADRGLPPPVTARRAVDDRAAQVTVRNHDLSSYDNLRPSEDGHEEA